MGYLYLLPPDNHHSSDDAYRRRGEGASWEASGELKGPVVGKAAATLQTDESTPGRVVAGDVVAPHVLVQIAALREGALAVRAHVRPVAGVQANVCLEVAALSKAAMARVADERTVAAVNAFVSPQVGRLAQTHNTCIQCSGVEEIPSPVPSLTLLLSRSSLLNSLPFFSSHYK